MKELKKIKHKRLRPDSIGFLYERSPENIHHLSEFADKDDVIYDLVFTTFDLEQYPQSEAKGKFEQLLESYDLTIYDTLKELRAKIPSDHVKGLDRFIREL